MATLVELYEEQARGCIELAERLGEPNLREALLKTARDWLRDAAALRRAERRRAGAGDIKRRPSFR
jgi:hypothetical protein